MRFYYGFRVKLMIFMALTNCFRKNNFYALLEFFFHLLSFCSPINDLLSPSEGSSYFFGGIIQLRHFLQLSNVCYEFEYICFKKTSVNF